jgi:hypothetical protein
VDNLKIGLIDNRIPKKQYEQGSLTIKIKGVLHEKEKQKNGNCTCVCNSTKHNDH